MKVLFFPLLVIITACLVSTGCQTTPEHFPEDLRQGDTTPPVVMMGSTVQNSIVCVGLQEQPLADGRLQVIARLQNREGHTVELQVNCAFKDAQGFSTGDETPYELLRLTENAAQDVRFSSANNLAKKYTIHVREAR